MSFLIYQIVKLKSFIITASVLGILLMLTGLVLAVRPKRGLGDYGMQAFFLHRDYKECLYLSCTLLQLAFAVSCLVSGTELSTIHLLLIGALCIGKAAAFPSPISFVTDVLYSVFLVFVLLASNLLHGYLQQISGDAGLLVVYWLLKIFILEYALYDSLHSVQVMLGRKRLFENVRIRKERRKRIREKREDMYG